MTVGVANSLKRESKLDVKPQMDNSQPVNCEVCGKEFAQKHQLAMHMKTHAPPAQMVECDICKRQVNHKQLANHMIMHEFLSKPKPQTPNGKHLPSNGNAS